MGDYPQVQRDAVRVADEDPGGDCLADPLEQRGVGRGSGLPVLLLASRRLERAREKLFARNQRRNKEGPR